MIMKQLELPLKFKPNTYESYTDTQKKEYWEANYHIQLHKIENAVRLLEYLINDIDRMERDEDYHWSNTMTKGKIRKICKDLVK